MVRAVLVAGTTVAVALVWVAQPVAESTLDRRATLERYAPVLRFAESELWLPIDPGVFERDARLQARSGPELHPEWKDADRQHPLPSSRASCAAPCALNLRCDLPQRGARCYRGRAETIRRTVKPTVYGELIRVVTPLDFKPPADAPTAYVARYWFFYYFDDWRWQWRHHSFTQAHEGDWEGISIGLDSKGAALWAAYNQHCEGTWRDWPHVTRQPRTGSNPIVYVGLGSHASYFTTEPRPTYPVLCMAKYSSKGTVGPFIRRLKGLVERRTKIVDATGTANEIAPTFSGTGPARLVDLADVTADWKSFAGIWGEGQFVYFGDTPGLTAKRGESPTTPHFGSVERKDFWHDPGS
jgi:hypothetical protein